jgi:hypothetical protein
MNQALAGGLASYLSLAVKKATEGDPTANIAGHALAGAVIAYLQGDSVSGGLAGNSLNAAGTGAVCGKVAVENNFLSQGSPRKYAEKYKKCNGEADCEQNIRKDMARESAENVQKLRC